MFFVSLLQFTTSHHKQSHLSSNYTLVNLWLTQHTHTHTHTHTHGFPGSSAGKESTFNGADLGSIHGLGRCPGAGHGNPLQYSCLENPHGQGSLRHYSPWGCKESDMTERLSTAQHTHTNTHIHTHTHTHIMLHAYRYVQVCTHNTILEFDSVTPWTVALLASLFMEFSRQVVLHLSNPGIDPSSFVSPALVHRFFTTGTT